MTTFRPLSGAALFAATLLACDTAPEGDHFGFSDTEADPGIVLSDGSDASSSDESDAESSSDDGATDDTGMDLACGEHDIEVERTVPQVVLVLDKSQSMVAYAWDNDGLLSTPDVTRWHSLHDVTTELVEALEDEIAFGAVLFPSAALTETVEATACTVEDEPDVAVALGSAADIADALPPADSLEIHGATPTFAGIQTALEHLRTLDATQPRAIVLVTDGAANCPSDGPVFGAYDENLAPLVAEAAAEGIPTYVVGIDIVNGFVGPSVGNPHERMSELAVAGGVPADGDDPYYLARDESALRDAVDSIAGQIQCRIELEDLPDDPDLVHLQLEGDELAHADSCEDGRGWRYTGDGAVELCAQSCDEYTVTGSIHARFECTPEG